MITPTEIKQNEQIRTYIEKADEALAALGYTEHSYAHVTRVAHFAEKIMADRPRPSQTIRFNAMKTDAAGFENYLRTHDVIFERGIVPGAYRCPAAGNLARLDGFRNGYFSIQGESSMLAALAVEPKPGMNVLDACAAPGGKSALIAETMADVGRVYAWDVHEHRVELIRATKQRLKLDSLRPAVRDARQPYADFDLYMDAVLVDAPCSGEGMFRRQPEARDEWDADAPRRCADRQMEILAQAAKMLRPGGTMVYSTCTFNDTENEGVLKRFLALHPEFSLVPFALPGLPEAKDGYLHLYPHEMRGEGHFVSRLKKADGADKADAPVQAAPQRKAPARAAAKGKAPAPIVLPDVFSDAFAPERLYTAGDALWMLPEGISIERLSGLRVLRTGLLLAHAEGKRSEPDHALAMALHPEEAARTASLTQTQALAYQAGETLSLGDLPGGYTLLCCEGVSLGWGKQAGGLMKNHYPKGLRRR